MTRRVKIFPAMIFVVTLNVMALSQTPERRPATFKPQTLEQAQNSNSDDTMVNEIALLRKSLQTLNSRLSEISGKIPTPEVKPGGATNDKQSRIAGDLNVLTLAEQRAEGLRKQLLEWIEKDTELRSRKVQIEEDMRPENIDRALSLIGTTRTLELRDARRRVLENERRGVEGLLEQTNQNRLRLEEDVRQANDMVSRLRQRLLPLIDKEIESINPNQTP